MDFSLTCPIPLDRYPRVLLAHGGGGRLMHQLIDDIFLRAFGDRETVQHDAAVLPFAGGKLAMTTDSYVVNPLVFPGGDIGTMAVCGTTNDLAMAGARPLYLSAGFILEEGLSVETLWQVVCSMQATAEKANVRIVTGDTKVVERGKGDGIFINTTGVGVVEGDREISPARVRPGDAIILNGDLGRHGIAVMASREGLEFETPIESDVAPLANDVLRLLNSGIEVRCLRDLTRGGLASALNEIAAAAKVEIAIDEGKIPVREDVRGACEILGFDPLYVANEGRFVAFVAPEDAERAVEILGHSATIVGGVENGETAIVTMESAIGAKRIVDMLSGEQLPRIC